MRRVHGCRGFGASVAFAALAALLWPGLALAAGPSWRPVLVGYASLLGLLHLALFGTARLRALRARLLRTLAVELLLAGGAAGLAGAVGGPGPGGTALSLWAFFLVESAGLLLPAAAPRAAAGEPDPFEGALRSARALLEEDA